MLKRVLPFDEQQQDRISLVKVSHFYYWRKFRETRSYLYEFRVS